MCQSENHIVQHCLVGSKVHKQQTKAHAGQQKQVPIAQTHIKQMPDTSRGTQHVDACPTMEQHKPN